MRAENNIALIEPYRRCNCRITRSSLHKSSAFFWKPVVKSNPDNIYASPLNQVSDFSFDETVVDVFPDMIQRSIPGYTTIISTIGKFTSRFHQENTRIYDLGCSLGAATLSARRALANKYAEQDDNRKRAEIIAVDNSQAMIDRCQRYVDAYKSTIPVDLQLANLQDVTIENASVVILNFTLQFLAPAEREAVIQKIYDGLTPGGVLILSEKIHEEDNDIDNTLVDLHHDFKRANGYSELEISQKRTALENVMRPDSLQDNIQRLTQAGFEQTSTWYQCFNFCSFFAIKPSCSSSKTASED